MAETSIDRELRRERFPGIVVLRMLHEMTGLPTLLGLGMLVLIGAVIPNAMALSLGLLASSAARGASTGTATPILLPLVAVGATFLLSSILGPILEVVGRALGRDFETKLRDEAMNAASSVAGIAHLEDPRNTDRLVAVEDLMQGWLVPRSPQGLIESWTGRLRGFIAALILATFAWWAPVLVFAAYRLSRAWSLKTGFLYLRRHVTNTQPLRRAAYVRQMLQGGVAAKEARVFGISDWFVERFRSAFDSGMEEIWRDRARVPLAGTPISLLTAAVLGFVCYRIGLAGSQGLAIGSIVVYLQSVFGMSGFLATGDPEWQMHFGAYRARDAQRLRETIRTEASDLRGDIVPAPLSSSLRFEGVCFAYPGQERDVLRGVNFEMPAGTSLAIVGENGAGKTTSIKLLSRLYDPTKGRILIDGVDLKTIDPLEWRRQVGVIFQDFIRYELSARENIGYGALELLDDTEALRKAAKLAGADGFLDRVGWDVPLSRRYEGGADLSGGEWQRIALARALVATQRGARLLILDEPTANLDVRAEAAIYEQFLEMTQGVTTILISHRFSTVRLADKIVVIEGGVVVESGSHEELLELNGRYATMFRSQASAYDDFDPQEPLHA